VSDIIEQLKRRVERKRQEELPGSLEDASVGVTKVGMLKIDFDALMRLYTGAAFVIAWADRDINRYQAMTVRHERCIKDTIEAVLPRFRSITLFWNHVLCRWELADGRGDVNVEFETMASAIARLTTWVKKLCEED
jgi:hypothetical protein